MGAKRWIPLYFFRFQPSELTKLFLPVFIAYYFAEQVPAKYHFANNKIKFFWDSITYPTITKQSVLFHGQFCQSGFAFRNSNGEAECIDVN